MSDALAMFFLFTPLSLSIVACVHLNNKLHKIYPTANDFKWWYFIGCCISLYSFIAILLISADILGEFESSIYTISYLTILLITGILVLNRKRYGFIVATTLLFIPIIWIINWFYLKERWVELDSKCNLLDLLRFKFDCNMESLTNDTKDRCNPVDIAADNPTNISPLSSNSYLQIDDLNDNFINRLKSLLSKLNYKRGLFRIWIVLSIIWIAVTTNIYSEDAYYTFRYIFNQNSIKQSVNNKIANDIKTLDMASEIIECKMNDSVLFEFGLRMKNFKTYYVFEDLYGLENDVINYHESYCNNDNISKMPKLLRQSVIDRKTTRKKELMSKITSSRNESTESFNRPIAKPDYEWVLVVFIAPILVIPIAYIGLFLINIGIKIIRWVWLGFK